MKFFRSLLFVGLATFLSACAGFHLGRAPDAAEPVAVSGEAVKPATVVATDVTAQDDASLPKVDEIDKVIEEANPVLAELSGSDDKVPLHIPLEINRKVAQWIYFFTVKERERTQRYLERGEALRNHIEQILKDNDMPAELYYLAMIESGFVTHARSRARAVGVWQFMKGTGKNYGLTVNNQLDERRNWIKATEAAASYLKDLNNVFGSWYLALAAYNAGEHRIVRSIMKGKTRDFWALAEGKMLPRETLNYVPKFIAAQIVGRHPEKFGFKLEMKDEDRWEDYTAVSVPSGIPLRNLAKVAGVEYQTLKKWNEDLIRGYTPQVKGGLVDIYVPKAHYAKFEENREEIGKIKPVRFGSRRYASSDDGGAAHSIYVVRTGDSLYSISRALGTSIRTLMKVNGLRRSRIHPGQRLKFYTKEQRVPASRVARSKAGKRAAVYVVRRGDNLSDISRSLGTSVSHLKNTNDLDGNKIYPGQHLKYYAQN